MGQETAALQSQVQEAASRLLHAYTRIGGALKALHEHSPGYPTASDGPGSAELTQPERYEATMRDEALQDLATLRKSVKRVFGEAATVYDLCQRWGVPVANVAPEEAPEGACVSCWRNRRHYEPTAEGRYANLCRFCGDYSRDYQQRPPMPVLRAKHEGRRITRNLIEKHQPKRKKAS